MNSVLVGWTLSVLGISILGVLIDIILPEGNMQKYIKSIFSIFIIFVIVSPIVNFDINNIKFNNIFYNQSSVQLDQSYIQNFNIKYKQSLEKTCENYLEEKGFSGVKVEIEINLENNYLEIKKVELNLKNLVINSNSAHINKYTEMKTHIKNLLNIEDEKVVFDEWSKKKEFLKRFAG